MPYSDIEKQREYQRVWRQRRRDDYLKDKSCVVCGSSELLEIDHIDPKLKVSHNIWSWTQARRDKELEKCQILCRTHHQDKTALDHGHSREHGNEGKYSTGCRCEPCVHNHYERWKLWNLRRQGLV